MDGERLGLDALIEDLLSDQTFAELEKNPTWHCKQCVDKLPAEMKHWWVKFNDMLQVPFNFMIICRVQKTWEGEEFMWHFDYENGPIVATFNPKKHLYSVCLFDNLEMARQICFKPNLEFDNFPASFISLASRGMKTWENTRPEANGELIAHLSAMKEAVECICHVSQSAEKVRSDYSELLKRQEEERKEFIDNYGKLGVKAAAMIKARMRSLK